MIKYFQEYLLNCLIFLILCSKLINAGDLLDNSKSDDGSQIQVRSVFINCEPNKRGSNSIDGEATRFEREELYKHGILQSCKKKLAVTVKIANEPTIRNSDDEYIPIEHVIEGTKRKRQRLLDPYILRLRREPPLQAYKLRKMDTVSGILTNSVTGENYKRKRARLQRDLNNILKYEDNGASNFSVRSMRAPRQSVSVFIPTSVAVAEEECDPNITSEKRLKRHEHNVVVEEEIKEGKITPWVAQKQLYRRLNDGSNNPDILKDTPQIMTTDEKQRRSMFFNNNNDIVKTSPRPLHYNIKYRHNSKLSHSRDNGNINSYTYEEKYKYVTTPKVTGLREHGISALKYIEENLVTKEENDFDSAEKDFALYEISDPDLWHSVHVQLYEKISTPEGKTVWNDLTKGEPASVSSLSPEWTGQDMSVKYLPVEWMSKNEFALPPSGFCLLTPLREKSNTFDQKEGSIVDSDYMVVPVDDIVGLEDTGSNLKKLDGNFSDSKFTTAGSQNKQCQRRVLVRTTRALFGGGEQTLGIASHGDNDYLTLPHRRRHHAQIDIEVRADENQLVHVGSSGRIATVVADSTRSKRIALTVQATNTGLAAARFRAVTRDCNPELSGLFNEKNAEAPTTNPLLIPPRHTRRFRLELPVEIPIDIVHCSVALINDDDESVAVRDVAIKRDDRCFCVWHCDCVCLSEDPKLLCREMPVSRQTAAGLEIRDRPRPGRSVCYPDVVTLNIFVIIIGVLMALLFLGAVKACLGLIFKCIGSWGLDRLLQMPRKLDRYYETSLRSRTVQYDAEGWPIHPDSKERTVRLVSKSMEFFLNVIFFVTIPCIATYEIAKRIASVFRNPDKKDHIKNSSNNYRKCYSSRAMQGFESRLRRHDSQRKWMTPGAQELSTDIWQKGLKPQVSIKCEYYQAKSHLLKSAYWAICDGQLRNPILCVDRHEDVFDLYHLLRSYDKLLEVCMQMQPLLQHESHRGDPNDVQATIDSEQDDTDYVLMQMQKSRESLAKSQRKLSESGLSSDKHIRKCDGGFTKK